MPPFILSVESRGDDLGGEKEGVEHLDHETVKENLLGLVFSPFCKTLWQGEMATFLL